MASYPDQSQFSTNTQTSFKRTANNSNAGQQASSSTAPGSIIPSTANTAVRSRLAQKNIWELDQNISGSTDLSGESKASIPHQRSNNIDSLLERYVMGQQLGQ
jgi:hypothetical protein